MESYCGDIEDYKKYLKSEKNNCRYDDPDMKRERGAVYYENLVKFLKHQEMEMKNRLHGEAWEFEFVYKNSQVYNNGSPDSIQVTYKVNSVEKKLFLRSDQFGFTALQGIKGVHKSWTNKYPYAKYLKYNNEDKTSCDFVADCIWSTRTIGGSFIWPIQKQCNKWCTYYNTARGIRNYLEDRVDLTLLEVKHYLDDPEFYKKNNPYNDILYSSIKGDTSPMEDFLAHFGSFKNYVQYFHFDNFVEKINENTLMPLNVVWSDLEKNIKVLLENEPEHKTNRIKNLDKKTLKKMLKNVRILTSERTQWIENNIFNYKNN
ncbi:DUF6994 family protein [Anaerocolumna jejuensis]|uniref:DUF6994 family protein n=1 Tax=Anaerocolumna jejuensis TaxID=259063 RepID=UPI003F7C1B43